MQQERKGGAADLMIEILFSESLLSFLSRHSLNLLIEAKNVCCF